MPASDPWQFELHGETLDLLPKNVYKGQTVTKLLLELEMGLRSVRFVLEPGDGTRYDILLAPVPGEYNLTADPSFPMVEGVRTLPVAVVLLNLNQRASVVRDLRGYTHWSDLADIMGMQTAAVVASFLQCLSQLLTLEAEIRT